MILAGPGTRDEGEVKDLEVLLTIEAVVDAGEERPDGEGYRNRVSHERNVGQTCVS